ncbi:MAG: T9SS type A sorting domain-containing protein [Candidatus Kapaibacterium sp.]
MPSFRSVSSVFVVLACILCTAEGLAQKTFEELRRDYQQSVEVPGSDGKVKINKQFRRWEWFWQSRVMPDGTLPTSAVYLNELQHLQERKASEDVMAPKTWKELGPIAPDMPSALSTWNGIGRVNCIEFSRKDPNVLYAGAAAGGIWKTTNGGTLWRPLNIPSIPVIGISDMAIAPSNDDVMYVATGDANGAIPGQLSRYNTFSYGIIKTTDGGLTWKQTNFTNEPADNALIGRLWDDPRDPNIVVAATYAGMYRTTNGGANWTRTAQGIFRELVGNPVSVPTLYAATYGFNGGATIYRSTDAGVTWNDVYSIAQANRIRLAVTKANQNVVVALASNASSQGFEGVYKSNDAGSSFAELPTSLNLLGWQASGRDNGGQGFYDLALEVSPTNANHIFVGGVNIWRTTTEGRDWVLSAHWTGDGGAPFVHADQHSFRFHPSNNRLYATHDGGVARSTDGGISWRDISNGLAIQQYYGLATSNVNPSITIAGAQDNGTALSKNGGATFVHTLDGDGMLGAIDAVSPSIMYGSQYYGNFWRTSNAGSNWTFVSSAQARGEGNASWVAPIAVDPRLQSTVFIGYTQVWKSTNSGSNWTKISNIPTSTSARVIAVAPSNSNYIYVAYNTSMYFTTNGGTSWQQQSGISGFIMGIDVHPTQPDKFYVAIGGFSQGQKMYQVDKGVVTNITGTGMPNVPCNSVVYQRGATNRLYAGTDVGVFVSDEGSGFWQLYGSGLPPVVVTGMRLISSSNLLRISTYGRGIWEVDVSQCAATTPKIAALTPTTRCAGDTVVLEADAGFASYRWSNGDTTRRIRLWNTGQTGSYQVGVEDTKGCRATSSAIAVSLNKLPSKPLISKVAPDTLRSSALGGVTKFQWSRNGVAIPGATSRALRTTQSGTYRVTVSDATCSNISDEFAFAYDGTSVSDEGSGRDLLTITPIPVVDELTVNLPQRSQRMIEIVDLSGRILYRGAVADDLFVFQTSTASWSSGMYIVQLRSSSGIWTATFIKQ